MLKKKRIILRENILELSIYFFITNHSFFDYIINLEILYIYIFTMYIVSYIYIYIYISYTYINFKIICFS